MNITQLNPVQQQIIADAMAKLQVPSIPQFPVQEMAQPQPAAPVNPVQANAGAIEYPIAMVDGKPVVIVPLEEAMSRLKDQYLPAQPEVPGAFSKEQVAQTGDNMITGTLGSVNDGMKTGVDMILGIVGGVAGLAIDILTLGQGKKK